MRKAKILYIYAILLLIFSCKNREEMIVEKNGLMYHYSTVQGRKEGNLFALSQQGDTIIYANYENDKLEGSMLIYDSLKRLKRIEHYKNDKLDSTTTDYYSTGELKFKSEYFEGKANGKWFDYHKSGSIKRFYFYENDTLRYYKAYNNEGYYYDGYIDIEILKLKTDSIEIKPRYLNSANSAIGVAIGNLDSSFNLTDTIYRWATKKDQVKIPLSIFDRKILEGKLLEIDLDSNLLANEYYFRYDVEKDSNLVKPIIDFKEFYKIKNK